MLKSRIKTENKEFFGGGGGRMCKTGRISVMGQGQGWLGINCRVIQVSELKGELENKITN